MPPPRPSTLRPEQTWRSAREPLFWLAADLRLSWANPAFEAATGFSVEALAAATAAGSDAADPADILAALAAPPEAVAGRFATTAAHFVRVDGGPSRRSIAFQPFTDEKGGLLGILGRILDADEPPPAPADGGESEAHRLRVRLMDARAALRERFGSDSLVGEGPAHRRLLEQVRVAAAVRRPVLFIGEPGTGKRHAARVVHQLGADADASLRAFDCEALPAEVLDRELFEAAAPDSPPAPPRLAADEGSSILIGDLAALPRDLQAKLASAIESGGEGVRVLAVTAADPEAAVRSEALREDLYLALSVMTIRLAPLRERHDEIPLLAQGFLERLNRRGDRQRAGFTRAAEDVLSGYHWPGNLREMARVVEHAHARGDGPLVDAADLPADIRGNLGDAHPPPKPAPPRPLDEILVDVERRLIENAMARARRNKSRAAELLGVSRPRLYRRLKELGFPDAED